MIDPLLQALRESRDVADWSVHGTRSRRLSLGIKDTEAGNAHAPLGVTEGRAARYLIVWHDGRVSRGALERRQLEQPAEALRDARLAAYDDPDAAQVLGPAPMPEVVLYDEEAAATARGDTARIAARLAAVRERVRPPRASTWSGSISAGEGESRLVTSAGLDVAGRGTSTGWHVTVDGETGDGFGARAAESDDEFLARLERLLETARALREPAEPLAGGSHPVLLHPRVVQQYALQTLMHHLEGSTLDHGEGRFSREDFGGNEPRLRNDLHLRLDPLQPLKSGSYRFTGEGLPAARCSFVEAGRLVQPILDLKYARRLGLPPTPIPYAGDVIEFGGERTLSLAEALERAAGGALVLSVLGVHTQDGASGDFSLSAPQVLRIADGGWAGRMRATISGNLFELLNADDLAFVRFDGEHLPGMLVRCRLDPK